MNLDLLFALIFYGVIILLYIIFKDKFETQDKIFITYKTKLGLNFMDSFSKKFPRLLNFLSTLSIAAGFIGMIFIFYTLVKGAITLVISPTSQPVVAPVLPGVQIPGAPVLSFWHWIIAILIVATVHELAHGIYSRLYGVKIKSSGFAFLGPILAAFVEPDEKQVKKLETKKQLAIFSAGPFSNIIWGIIFFVILSLVIMPLSISSMPNDGIVVNTLIEGYPAEQSGLEAPFKILAIDDNQTLDYVSFVNVIQDLKPNQNITLTTDQGVYSITTTTNPENASKGYMGITDFQIGSKTLEWIRLLFLWLFIINIGVGLFNLLPLGPVDGGRMFYVALIPIMKTEKRAKRVYAFVSMLCIGLIIVNLLPWLIKLFNFIVSIFV